MLLKSRGLIALAIVVCASLLALVFKGMTEWATDLVISACAGLAGKIKGSPSVETPTVETPTARTSRKAHLVGRRRRRWRHRPSRRVHRPARLRSRVRQ